MRTFNLLASLFLLCLLTAFSAAYAQEPAQGGQALDQAANDPTASLMNVQIQNVYTGDYHNLKGESGNAILLRSAVPFKTGPLNHIARATLPIVTKSPSGESGLSDLVYQPMLELLAYLRANDFKTYIVSGGGIEFVRTFAEPVYGVPPEQVIGSSVKTRYEVRDGQPVIARLGEIDFIDDKAGKPVGIHKFIGRRPLMAFGNSDGDFEMLEWTTSGPGPRFGLIVHHDDAVREWAYDRDSPIGRLNRGLDEGPQRGWVIASIQRDWQRVYAFEKK